MYSLELDVDPYSRTLGSSLYHQMADCEQAKFAPVSIIKESVRPKGCASGQFILKGG